MKQWIKEIEKRRSKVARIRAWLINHLEDLDAYDWPDGWPDECADKAYMYLGQADNSLSDLQDALREMVKEE